MRCMACAWPPAERSVLTRPDTLAAMPMSWPPPESSGNVSMAGTKASWQRPLHVNPLWCARPEWASLCQHGDVSGLYTMTTLARKAEGPLLAQT